MSYQDFFFFFLEKQNQFYMYFGTGKFIGKSETVLIIMTVLKKIQ